MQNKSTLKNLFGGNRLAGKRKGLRPLSRNQPFLCILAKNVHYREVSFLTPRLARMARQVVLKSAKNFGVRVLKVELESSSICLELRIRRKTQYKQFIRTITGLIARKALRCEKGQPLSAGSLWQNRPLTAWLPGEAFTKNRISIMVATVFGLSPMELFNASG